MENLFTPNCIRTHSGIYINPFEPTPDQITIEDIAHSLSMQCRFAGHLPKFYSVAQHSVECSNMVNSHFQLQALMHDASEAYLLDIPSPIKKVIPAYRSAENNLMNIIAEKFGFTYPLYKIVKWADQEMLEFEWDKIMLQNKFIKYAEFPSKNFFECWSPEQAEEEFLNQYNRIIHSQNTKFNNPT